MPMCVLFVSSTSGIVYNPNEGAINDYSQSAKDIDPYFSQSSVEDPSHCKLVLIVLNELSKPGEQVTIENNFCHWWDLNPQPLDQ